jgi:hypothetical protein
LDALTVPEPRAAPTQQALPNSTTNRMTCAGNLSTVQTKAKLPLPNDTPALHSTRHELK